MNQVSPLEITGQVSLACAAISDRLADTVIAIHLFGSAADGGLKQLSDIDLLVTVNVRPNEETRQGLMLDLLKCSVPVNNRGLWRPLEVTVIVQKDVLPWRHPPRRELQFGEWLRQDLLAGVFAPPARDQDLAILLTKARQHSVALIGAPAQMLFEPVPKPDFFVALSSAVAQWGSEDNWEGDERNVVLALARIWYSASTGQIAPKDIAAAWALERLSPKYRPVLSRALRQYVGGEQDSHVIDSEQLTVFVHFVSSVIEAILAAVIRPMRGRSRPMNQVAKAGR